MISFVGQDSDNFCWDQPIYIDATFAKDKNLEKAHYPGRQLSDSIQAKKPQNAFVNKMWMAESVQNGKLTRFRSYSARSSDFNFLSVFFRLTAEERKFRKSLIIFAGIGRPVEEEKVRHDVSYYVHLPLLLALSGLVFLAPKLFWMVHEKGFIANATKDMLFRPTNPKELNRMAQKLRLFLFNSDETSLNAYLMWNLIAEGLNVIVLGLVVLVTNYILKGQFLYFGIDMLNYYEFLTGSKPEAAPWNMVFPVKTSCDTFRTGGGGKKVSTNIHSSSPR